MIIGEVYSSIDPFLIDWICDKDKQDRDEFIQTPLIKWICDKDDWDRDKFKNLFLNLSRF